MKYLKSIIGANFGDEGKGLVTDYFCHQATQNNNTCLVVLTNGGAQRGHTVETATGKKHVFKHFGSGTFAGADTYFSEQFILDPMTFRKEYTELDLPNVKYFTHKFCRWVTPWDILVNQIVETHRAENRLGSCGMGIWETVVRCSSTINENITDFHFCLNIEQKIEYLKRIRAYAENRLKNYYKIDIPDFWKSIFFSDELIYHFIDDIRFFCETVKLAAVNIFDTYDTVVCENGQGLLLGEQYMNIYGNNTTPSNTGIANLTKIATEKDIDIEAVYVSRSYMTRHGAGDFLTERSDLGKVFQDLTNIENEFQGKLRYGDLNSNSLKRRIFEDVKNIKIPVKTSLVITHLNENNLDLTPFDCLGIDGLYTSNNRTRESIVKVV